MKTWTATMLVTVSFASLGQTPHPSEGRESTKPQRTINGPSPVSSGKASDTADSERGGRANERALDALTASTDDLNAIRDGNVRRLSSDGCPRNVSARIAEVRARLLSAEAELSGVETRAPAAEKKPAPAAPQGSPLAVADSWFKSADAPSTSATEQMAGRKELVDSVLPGATARPVAPARMPLTPERRKTLEQDIAGLKDELAHLEVACPGAKK